VPALTILDNIKGVAQDDQNIQALNAEDRVVAFVLGLVDIMVPDAKFGAKTLYAQTYLGAHLLSLAFTVAGGQGPLSGESIGGISQSFTLPYLNQTSVIASTQYGVMYLDLVRAVTVPAIVVKAIE